MIREATIGDVSEILGLAFEFGEETDINSTIPLDENSLRNFALGLLESESGIMLVVECGGDIIGVVSGFVSPHPFNNNIITCSELLWFIKKDFRTGYGIKLLRAYEEAQKIRGVNLSIMLCRENLNPRVIGHIYKRNGYSLEEHSYMKEL